MRRRSCLLVLVIGISVVLCSSPALAFPRRAITVFHVRHLAGDIVGGSDGAIWAGGTFALVRVGVSGDIRYVNVPNESNYGMVVGPDGALWYATGSGVGRYLPGDGPPELLTFPQAMESHGVAFGPDGALWVTDPSGRKLVRRGSDGSIRVLHMGRFAPQEVTVSADGGVWLSDIYEPRVARIDNAGTMRVFVLPGRAGAATGLTEGPDRAIWFTRRGITSFTDVRPVIGRITTDGRVQQFSRGLAQQAYPGGIVTGPDGNLWFTEIAGIGRITPEGEITNYNFYRRAPGGIAAGSDGALWFTDTYQDTISRMPLSVCTSRRVVRVHLRSGSGDPITWVTRVDRFEHRAIKGSTTVVVAVDLRRYVLGPVHVVLHAITRHHHQIWYDRVFHPCAGAAS